MAHASNGRSGRSKAGLLRWRRQTGEENRGIWLANGKHVKSRGRDVMYHYRVLLYSRQYNKLGYGSIVQHRTLDPVIFTLLLSGELHEGDPVTPRRIELWM